MQTAAFLRLWTGKFQKPISSLTADLAFAPEQPKASIGSSEMGIPHYPTDESNDHTQRIPPPDIVGENHRQPSGQRDYAEGQHHRWVLKKGCHRFHGGLSASHHG